jgi:hypothetical protein
MKIECSCGHVIADGSDGLTHKAHFVPDRKWFPLFDDIDGVLLHECASPEAREAACTKIRSLLTAASKLAWECSACGKLYLDGPAGAARAYTPDSRRSANALAS